MRHGFALIIGALLVAAPAGDGRAQEHDRVALVIGNTAYANLNPVRTATVDTRSLSRTLTDLGFAVEEAVDFDRRRLFAAIGAFSDSAADAEVAVIAYFGLAQHDGDQTYLLPIDLRLGDRSQWSAEAIPLNDVLAAADAESLSLVLLDANRETGLPVEGAAPGPGEPGALPPGVVVSFAAAPGVAVEPDFSFQSPYGAALAAHIAAEDTPLTVVFERIAQTVDEQTGGAQQPVMFGALDRLDYRLNPAPEVTTPEVTVAATPEADAADAVSTDVETMADDDGPAPSVPSDVETASDTATDAGQADDPAEQGPAATGLSSGDDDEGSEAAVVGADVEAGADVEVDVDTGSDSEIASVADVAPPSVTEDVDLTADERRAIQRSLTTIGLYGARIDAIFGPLTRIGIRGFQARIGAEPTGYLSAAQIDLLHDTAAESR